MSYRHVVETYARALPELSAALSALDEQWCRYGAGWVRPTMAPLDLDEWLTGRDMADLFHQEPMTVYAWARRGKIRVQIGSDNLRRYNVGDVVNYQRQRRLHG